MRNLRGTYVHRGDARRRRNRIRQSVLAAGFFAAVAFVLGNRTPVPPDAMAAPVESASRFGFSLTNDRALSARLDSTRGELELMKLQMARATTIIGFSSKYEIGADLASRIVDVASAEGIDPELGFRLVKLESGFNPRATSPVGAVGLTQIMPATASFYVKNVSREHLYDPQVNLEVGFRYLRGLVREYHGNVKMALLVYNRGPAAVARARLQGDNPSNGYDRIVTRGYKGPGTIE